MKQKVAEFEYDEVVMESALRELAELLCDLEKEDAKDRVDKWISEIDFFVLPKAFTNKREKSDVFITSISVDNEPVNKVNLFINMPFELHLLETLWTMLVGKIVLDEGVLTEACYGNCLDNRTLYNRENEYINSINFNKNNLFKIYFYQYCRWRNNAIESVELANRNKKRTMLFSLDIKSFYYSVKWKFDELEAMFKDNENYIAIKPLTKILERIFKKYTKTISMYREIAQIYEKREYVLPIGMFSSMLIANIYMTSYDKRILNSQNVLYYGRYVDDILLLIDVSDQTREFNYETAFEHVLVDGGNILQQRKDGYNIYGYPDLEIQKEKVKIFYFDYPKAGSLIKQLKKTIKYPSQMNVIPRTEMQLADFEEAAYVIKNFNNETKIRDVGQIEIDRFQLGQYMSQLVINNKDKNLSLSNEERAVRQRERDQICNFFRGSRALEYSSNWVNVLYFLLLTEEKKYWKIIENNIREAIQKIRIEQIEGIVPKASKEIKRRMRLNLLSIFDISVATVLALNPRFSRKEREDIKELIKKIRKANLFNNNLVSFPLINYSDEIDGDCDLTRITPEFLRENNLIISNSRKSKLSPRFVNLHEIFEFVFLMQSTKGGNYYLDKGKYSVKDKLEYIQEYFWSVNRIYVPTAKPLAIDIKNEKKYNNYMVQRICLGTTHVLEKEVRIAIANVKMDIKRCCLGLKRIKDIKLSRKELVRFMERAYECADGKVDFLVLPEYYLPLQWISDVLEFVKKTGITVISGLQYVTCQTQAFNNVALFAPVDTGRYRNAIMLVREKNDYAPMEQVMLSVEQYECKNQEIPSYQIVSNKGIDYGIFLCYEFTDVTARSLYKNEVDMLFTPEYNRDTSYFSSIIETTVRDLHIFIAQANTSVYGDSRITGPYGKNDRNIVQIKGGDEDDIIIGTIDLLAVKAFQKEEKEEAQKIIQKNLAMDLKSRGEAEKKMFEKEHLKVSKTSARFSIERYK